MKVLGALFYKTDLGIKKYYGIRIMYNNRFYDIDMDTCKIYGVEVYNLPNEIELFNVDGQLYSQEEKDGLITVVDLSQDTELLDSLFYEQLDRDTLNISITQKPMYINGLAVILSEIRDIASEYKQIRLDYDLTICVENEVILERVAKALDWRLPLDAALNQFKVGKKDFDIKLSDKELKAFANVFDFKMHICTSGLVYNYENIFTKLKYEVIIKPPYFDLPFNTNFDYWTGTLSDGRSLSDFAKELTKSLKEGVAVCLDDSAR